MKVKFNKYERVAGLFVLATILGGFMILVGVAIKQGWFETKIRFETTLKNADGLRVGTSVQLSGFRAGSVVSVELRSGNEVRVTFEISEKYSELLREDSVVRTIRPFIISEKVIDVSVGDMKLAKLKPGADIRSEASADIMDLISGRTLAPHLETIGKMMENLRIVAEAILDPERSKDIIHIFDELQPLVKNMNGMAREVASLLKDGNKDKKMVGMINNLVMTTNEVNKMLPELNKIMPELAKMAPVLAKESPKLASDVSKIAGNLAILTDELQQTLPAVKEALREVGPEVPRATRRAMEALDETVVTLKALQKSFLLRANTKEVRDEEAERERVRLPANEQSDKKDKP